MTNIDVLQQFKDADAWSDGHFVLSSGRHSAVFIRKNLLFAQPARTQTVCTALAALITQRFGAVDLVISPAVGGIVPGYETARHLNAQAFYVERENGQFALRRGFVIWPQARIVLVEDIVTTGLSLTECANAVLPLAQAAGATVLGAACLIDRAGGQSTFTAQTGLPLLATVCIDIPSYAPDAVPPQLAALPITTPGSRHL